MKLNLLTTMVLLLSLSSCGLQSQIESLRNRAEDGEEHDIVQDNRLAALEASMQAAQTQLGLVGQAVSDQDTALQTQIDAINSQVAAISANGTATQTQLDTLSQTVQDAITAAIVLEGRVAAVEGSSSLLQLSTTQITDHLIYLNGELNTQFANIDVGITNLETAMQDVNTAVSSLESNVTVLQAQVSSSLVSIATLQGYNNIVSIKDPCGAQGAYNEVLLKLSNGKYLASFSETANGLNTRFVLLTDGNFRTTDGSGCYFTVSGSGTVISNEHN